MLPPPDSDDGRSQAEYRESEGCLSFLGTQGGLLDEGRSELKAGGKGAENRKGFQTQDLRRLWGEAGLGGVLAGCGVQGKASNGPGGLRGGWDTEGTRFAREESCLLGPWRALGGF